jgi:fatty acid synthase subunit alpha
LTIHLVISEPELFNGYDPKRKGFNQEIELTHDLEPLEVSEVEAAKFKLEHGDKVDAWVRESGEWAVKFKKGARILVPKAVHFDRLVAGQIPTGWHAGRYGIPDDIVAQTDRTALWALVCTAEALIMAGITDPYELYKYVHPSEVGTSVGSGMGGMQSLSAMFRDRREEKDVQKDILQETYVLYYYNRRNLANTLVQVHQHCRRMGQLAPSVVCRSGQDSRWCLVSYTCAACSG